MNTIVKRLQENRQVELAKSILESEGYTVAKKMNESSELLDQISEYDEDLWSIMSNPEDYGFSDEYYDEGDINPIEGIEKAIEEYLQVSPRNVILICGEGEVDHELFSELQYEFKKVSDGETFYQGMGTGEGVEYGTVDGEKVICWWVGGAAPNYIFPAR